MATNPFRIVLKLPKPAAPSDQQPVDSKTDKQHKKKKRRKLEPAEGLDTLASPSSAPQGTQPAERDAFRDTKRPKVEAQQPTRNRSSNDAGAASADTTLKPRLVIKLGGSFGKPRDAGLSSRSGPSGPVSKKLHSQPEQEAVRLHKERKKKRHREKLPGLTSPGQPSPAKLLSQLPAKVRPTLPAIPKQEPPSEPESKAQPAGAAKLNPQAASAAPAPMTGPPAKPPLPRPFSANSQAPSTVTGMSVEVAGQAVNSKPTGPPSAAGGPASGQPISGAPPGQDGSTSLPGQPDLLPGLGDVARLITRLQKKDPFNIFRDPVTDAVAPGYSAVIKRPMSFTQMLQRLERGEYSAWKPVQEDLEQIFNNAMVYNPPSSPYHTKARDLMGFARKLLQQLRTTGQMDARTRKPGVAMKAKPLPSAITLRPSPPLAEKRTERRVAARVEKPLKPRVDKKKLAAKRNAQRAAASGVLARPTYEDSRGDMGPLSAEENVRATWLPLMGTALEQQWKGLAKGISADGVSFAAGRPVLRPNFTGALTLECYAKSLKTFGAKLTGRGKALLEKYVAEAAKPPEPQPAPAANAIQPPMPQAWGNPTGGQNSVSVAWNPLAQGWTNNLATGGAQSNSSGPWPQQRPALGTLAGLQSGTQALSATNNPGAARLNLSTTAQQQPGLQKNAQHQPVGNTGRPGLVAASRAAAAGSQLQPLQAQLSQQATQTAQTTLSSPPPSRPIAATWNPPRAGQQPSAPPGISQQQTGARQEQPSPSSQATQPWQAGT